MSDPWSSPSKKLTRAAAHFESLHEATRIYIRDGRPFEYRAEIDKQPPRFRVRIVGGNPPPEDVSLIVGDFVQNLRASLDHLIWAAVEANGETPTNGNAFPILADSLESNRRAREQWDWQLRGIAPKALPLIEHIQPYKRGENADRDVLACVRRLSNEDKHRVVLQTVRAVPNPDEAAPDLDFEVKDMAEIESFELHAMKPLAVGDTVMEAAVQITGPDPNIRIKGELPIELAFGEPPIATSGLAEMFDRIDVIVAHLANELLGADLPPQPLGDRLGEATFERIQEGD